MRQVVFYFFQVNLRCKFLPVETQPLKISLFFVFRIEVYKIYDRLFGSCDLIPARYRMAFLLN